MDPTRLVSTVQAGEPYLLKWPVSVYPVCVSTVCFRHPCKLSPLNTSHVQWTEFAPSPCYGLMVLLKLFQILESPINGLSNNVYKGHVCHVKKKRRLRIGQLFGGSPTIASRYQESLVPMMSRIPETIQLQLYLHGKNRL